MSTAAIVNRVRHIDVVGLEFGRLVVQETFVAPHLKRRDQLRLLVECSCGQTFNVAARQIITGVRSMCSTCFHEFVEKYGTRPDKERITTEQVHQLAADRDAGQSEYLRIRKELGL
ncbi:hypothetical protein [Isoptericola sediminis]|uniref:Uncharacterized protein n=1 Tax=Isoptericola sediminis TaxID=2733572 RepID=A0A849KDY6_9MICO|nr:hypothetical protein [Isoptericola sediminis]NNU26793.1 hypothetical protein [Isoptericola sediminis]